MCGLDKVPTSWSFSRFLSKLLEEEINTIFNKLVAKLSVLLPDFGVNLAVDGKAIKTYARPRKKEAKHISYDRRRDADADFGKKVYRGQREDGTLWEKVVTWFGYKLHLLVDADYELPVAFTVTRASASEAPQAHTLLDKVEKTIRSFCLDANTLWLTGATTIGN